MPNHYHLVSKLDNSEYGSTNLDIGNNNTSYYGPGLPLLEDARRDAQELANERGLTKIAGSIWTDAPTADAFNTWWDAENTQYIFIDPCDNEIDFDIPWNAYKNANHQFVIAPKGQPCSSLFDKEYADKFAGL